MARPFRLSLAYIVIVFQCACMAVLAGTTSVRGHATGIVAATMLFLFK